MNLIDNRYLVLLSAISSSNCQLYTGTFFIICVGGSTYSALLDKCSLSLFVSSAKLLELTIPPLQFRCIITSVFYIVIFIINQLYQSQKIF